MEFKRENFVSGAFALGPNTYTLELSNGNWIVTLSTARMRQQTRFAATGDLHLDDKTLRMDDKIVMELVSGNNTFTSGKATFTITSSTPTVVCRIQGAIMTQDFY